MQQQALPPAVSKADIGWPRSLSCTINADNFHCGKLKWPKEAVQDKPAIKGSWVTVNEPGLSLESCIWSKDGEGGQIVYMSVPGSETALHLTCYPTVSRGTNIKADLAW